MALRVLPILALVCLVMSSAGCLEYMTDKLEEDREEARAREAQRRGGAESTEPGDAARIGSWPWPGSYVRYAVQGGEGAAAARVSWSSEIELIYDGTRWMGTCQELRTERNAEGVDETRRFAGSGVFTPIRGPADVRAGDTVTLDTLAECRVEPVTLVAQGVFPEDTFHEGAPVRTQAWWADEGSAREGTRDDDAWWDQETRLLLRWEAHAFEGDRSASGRLVDTDAPLG